MSSRQEKISRAPPRESWRTRGASRPIAVGASIMVMIALNMVVSVVSVWIMENGKWIEGCKVSCGTDGVA
jgi:hypothetical protein